MKIQSFVLLSLWPAFALPKVELNMGVSENLAIAPSVWHENAENAFGVEADVKYYPVQSHGLLWTVGLFRSTGNNDLDNGVRQDISQNVLHSELGYSYRIPVTNTFAWELDLGIGVAKGERVYETVVSDLTTRQSSDLGLGLAYKILMGPKWNLSSVILKPSLGYFGGKLDYKSPGIFSDLDMVSHQLPLHQIGVDMKLGYGF